MLKFLFGKYEGKAVSSHNTAEFRTLQAVRDAGEKLRCVYDDADQLEPPATFGKAEFNAAVGEHKTHELIKLKRRRITEDGKELTISLSAMQQGDSGPRSTEVADITLTPKGNDEIRFIESRWVRRGNAILVGVAIGLTVVVGGGIVLAMMGIKQLSTRQTETQPDDVAKAPVPFPSDGGLPVPPPGVRGSLPTFAKHEPIHFESHGDFLPLKNGLMAGAFENDGDKEAAVTKIDYADVESHDHDEPDGPNEATGVEPIYFVHEDFDPKSKCYSRPFSKTIKVGEFLPLRLAILDSTLPEGKLFRGTVILHSGETEVARRAAVLTVFHRKLKDDKPMDDNPKDEKPMDEK